MDRKIGGWLDGFVGMLIFSGTLPATRVALRGFDPIFLTAARASIAGVLGLAVLSMQRERFPGRGDWLSLSLAAGGGVIGFPLLAAFALRRISAAHSMAFVGLLPLSTACFGVIRGGERLRSPFWILSGLGALLVVGFTLRGPIHASGVGDLLMVGAVVLAGLGYAEGALLSRRLGGWQVIAWAVVASLPLSLPLACASSPATFRQIPNEAWVGLGYVSVFSMLVGFVFWYRGLAKGGIAAVGQLQLLQPFCGVLIAALLLHEAVSPGLVATMLTAALCVFGAKRFAT
jgi:drug/metabolite transporter (DMT)-like permease